MKKQININEEVNRINQIIENTNRIMEGLYIGDEYEPEGDGTFVPNEAPTEEEGERPAEQSPILDQIRKLTLQGMTELANEPDSFEFQNLKKVFMLLDKKPNNNQGSTN